jgi:hypothetical protein
MKAQDASMAMIINRDDVPSHLLNIHEVDLSGDLFADRLEGPWFRLGAQTMQERRDQRGVEEAVSRQSVLLNPEGFAVVFDKLESIGNVFHGLGRPGGVIRGGGGTRGYGYTPFHQFEFPFTRATPNHSFSFIRTRAASSSLSILIYGCISSWRKERQEAEYGGTRGAGLMFSLNASSMTAG